MRECIVEYFTTLRKRAQLSFQLEGCAIETIDSTQAIEGIADAADFGYLKISIEYAVEDNERISNGALLVRSKYLSILGVVSFLLDEPFDVFCGYTAYKTKMPENEDAKNDFIITCVIDGLDLTQKLIGLIDYLEKLKEHERGIFFSLLDRWRKARHMEYESEENYLYDDEVTLSYFHVLERLGELHSNQLKAKFDHLVEGFSHSFNSEILSLNHGSLASKTAANKKLICSILNKEITVSAKILHYLKEIGIYDDRITFWIKDLINARNGVAHGKTPQHKMAIYPVKPFFPLVPNHLYPLEYLRVLAAKTISSHAKLTLYNDRWKKVQESLIPDDFETKAFLKTKSFKAIDKLSKSEEQIVYGALNYFLIVQRIRPEDCMEFLRFYLQTQISNQDFLGANIDAIIISYESTKESAFEKDLEAAIGSIEQLKCNPYSKFRDACHELEYYGFKTLKIKELIKRGVVR